MASSSQTCISRRCGAGSLAGAGNTRHAQVLQSVPLRDVVSRRWHRILSCIGLRGRCIVYGYGACHPQVHAHSHGTDARNNRRGTRIQPLSSLPIDC